MRIKAIHVDGFGSLADLAIDDLSPTLSVISGQNEAGKSTLLDFIRTVLFGFPTRRGRIPLHEPLHGGRHGGTLGVVGEDGVEWVIERFADRKAPVLTSTDGRTGGPAELATLLGHADAGVFRSVFAFGLGELSSLEELEEDDVRDLIFTAGVLGAGRSATRAVQALGQRRESLLRQRANARANDLARRLDDAERTLRERRDASKRVAPRQAELRRLEGATESARTSRDDLERRIQHIDQLVACRPMFNRVTDVRSRLEKLTALTPSEQALLDQAASIDRLAEERSGHAVRSDNLTTHQAQLRGLEDSYRTRLSERKTLAGQLPGPDGSEAPRTEAELRAASRALAALRNLIGQRDQLVAQRALVQAAQPPPSRPAWAVAALAVTSLALAVVAAASIARHQVLLGLAVALAAAVVGAVAAGVSRGASRRREEVDPPAVTADVDLARLATEIAKLAGALGLATAPVLAEVDAAAAEIAAEQEDRGELDQLETRLRELDRELAALDEARPRLRAAIEVEAEAIAWFETEVEEIATAAGLGTDDGPFDTCGRLGAVLSKAREDDRQRRELAATLGDAEADLATVIGTGAAADLMIDELRTGRSDEWVAERSRLSAAAEEAADAYDAARDAELAARLTLDQLKTSGEVPELELECESLRTELDSVLEEWLRLGVATELLSETIARYERDRQPKVIAKATTLFSQVTEGRYEHLVAREDEHNRYGITAVAADGSHVDSTALSRGAKEQLYLCLRLALAATHAERTIPLPFVLDDVLVNFDPPRAARVAEAIAETAAAHQVLAFTCHPHLVELFQRVAPDCRLVELSAGD